MLDKVEICATNVHIVKQEARRKKLMNKSKVYST